MQEGACWGKTGFLTRVKGWLRCMGSSYVLTVLKGCLPAQRGMLGAFIMEAVGEVEWIVWSSFWGSCHRFTGLLLSGSSAQRKGSSTRALDLVLLGGSGNLREPLLCLLLHLVKNPNFLVSGHLYSLKNY